MFTKFKKDEDGAVTVDWVVLCGAIVAVALGVVTVVQGALNGAAGEVGTNLTTAITAGAAGIEGA
ncbi:MAG: pilus assembly protein, partial [Pseudomonadota bacterium]